MTDQPEKIEDGQPQIQRVVYTTAEAAAALGVNEATIYRLIARKKLRTVRALRHKRVANSVIPISFFVLVLVAFVFADSANVLFWSAFRFHQFAARSRRN